MVALGSGTIVWVVHDQASNATIDVLVPGYGVQAIERAKMRPETVPAFTSGFSSLEVRIYIEQEAFVGLRQLLKFLGAQLTRLTILKRGMDNDEDDDEDEDREEDTSVEVEVCEILRHCPRLLFLAMDGVHVIDTRILSKFFETHGCQLTELEFSKTGDDWIESVDTFYEAMSQDGRMSRQIRELGVKLRERTLAATTIVAMQEMLMTNRILEVCTFGVLSENMCLVERAIDLLPPTIVPVSRPLDMRSKLAILSVAREPKGSLAALSRLDSGIFSIILTFIAPHQERFVHVYPIRES